jgi:hypothetical protein
LVDCSAVRALGLIGIAAVPVVVLSLRSVIRWWLRQRLERLHVVTDATECARCGSSRGEANPLDWQRASHRLCRECADDLRAEGMEVAGPEIG